MNKHEDLFGKVKVRRFPEKNYNAVWHDLRTLRLGKGVAEELEPDRSEFYDVGINTKCNAGIDGSLGCEFCLPPNTKILTSKGEESIENIKVNDLVFSYNEDTGNIELKKVSQLFSRKYEGELIEIETENSTVRMTPNHKVFTENRGWVEAGKLNVDDIILSF